MTHNLPRSKNDGERLFLKELDWAAHRLQDLGFGAAFAKVICGTSLAKYCSHDVKYASVVAFREGQMKLLLPKMVLNRHAIVSTVLQLDMWPSIRIVKSATERRHLQEECHRNSSHLLFLYVKEIGSHEHREFLELLYAVLKENQRIDWTEKEDFLWIYAITTHKEATVGLPLPPTWEEEGRESLLWVLRCRTDNGSTHHRSLLSCQVAPDENKAVEGRWKDQGSNDPRGGGFFPEERTCPGGLQEDLINGDHGKESCQAFLHGGALEVLQMAAFVEAFHRPAWSKAILMDDRLISGFEDLGLPIAYVLYEPMQNVTAEECARNLATWFRGSLAVAIASFKDMETAQWNQWHVPTNSSGIVITGMGDGGKNIFTSGLNPRHDFVQECLEEARREKTSEERTARESLPEENIPQLIQDDPLALAARKLRTRRAKKATLLSLNDTTVESYIGERQLAFIFFSLPWESDCFLAELHLESALHSAGLDGAKVDCYDWTDVCQSHGIQTFPSLLAFVNGTRVGQYKELWQSTALAAFLARCHLASKHEFPVVLLSREEARLFKKGFSKKVPQATSYLAILNSNDTRAVNTFEKVSKKFLGSNRFAVAFDDIAQNLATEFGSRLPVVVALRPEDVFHNYSIFEMHGNISSEELSLFLKQEQMNTFPELNVNSLSDLRKKGGPLAVFIRDDSSRSSRIFSTLGNHFLN